MNKWEIVGKSNNKSIRVMSLDPKIKQLNSIEKISSALLLIYLSTDYPKDDLALIIKLALFAEPLGIFIAGKNARQAFDQLLSILSTSNTEKHVMTGVFNEKSFEENLELFLISSWPAEERFDEWDNYNILIVGHETNSKAMKLKNKIKNIQI